MRLTRPYLIFPKLIEQPTWGGTFISSYKGWDVKPGIRDKRIGQSYELSGNCLLSGTVIDASDSRFTGYFGGKGEELVKQGIAVELTSMTGLDSEDILGPIIYKTHGRMPLLIKFTQALGNSFQLHVKPEENQKKWIPKAESWYFLEKGKITLGVKPTTDIAEYENTCRRIDSYMKSLSASVISGKITIDEARKRAKEYIRKADPWQYVNVHYTVPGELIDLSGGGLHHSWEEDSALDDGNIVYEVQQDVTDDDSTLRSFDQGKIKDDGSIRPITVTDYFRYIDRDPARNDISNARVNRNGENLLRTKFYSMDRMELSSRRILTMDSSFHHLWALSGTVEVKTDGGTVRITKGHSCLVPFRAGSYEVTPRSGATVVLKTYIS